MAGWADGTKTHKRTTDMRFWLLWILSFVVVFVVVSLVLTLLIDDLGVFRAGIAGALAGASAVWIATYDLKRRTRCVSE